MPEQNYLKAVRDQYEAYPYPPREPTEEKQRLLVTVEDFLPLINHYGFAGKRDFSRNFRTLVAGGGVGDAAVHLAEQLRDSGGEVVYVDISQASLELAKARAAARGLGNVSWHHGSLLDVANMGLGEFDYINCSGVLHHLEEPETGLKALRSVLKPTGVMGLMVYGRYGRAAVYQMQELMRLINENEPDLAQRLANTKKTLAALPPTNWYRQDGAFRPADSDENLGDAGIVDLFLHPQDRPYSVPELYDFLASAEMRLVTTLFPLGGRAVYRPESFLPVAGKALAALENANEMERQAVAELLSGNMGKHTFYAVAEGRESTVANPEDPENIPFFHIVAMPPATLAGAARQGEGKKVTVKHPILGSVSFTGGAVVAALLENMDGNRPIGDILSLAGHKTGNDSEEIKNAFLALYKALNGKDWLLLRHKSVPAFAPFTG